MLSTKTIKYVVVNGRLVSEETPEEVKNGIIRCATVHLTFPFGIEL